MIHKVMIFGQLTDYTGSHQIDVTDIKDTDQLMDYLINAYPELQNKKFAIAIDNKIISQVMPLVEGSSIALMPPFSGG